jgi:hypothetical protein
MNESKRQEVCNVHHDEKSGVIFHIMAYYALTDDECRQKIANYQKSNTQKRMKPGSVETILIGQPT